MGRHVPRLAFIDVMFGDRPALSPPQIFYQRMLAGAPDEAVDQAHEFLRQRELATYYDEVALEGLRIAHEDVARFAVEGERLETLQRSTLELVEGLKSVRTSALGGRRGKKTMTAEAAAAVDAAGPDQRSRASSSGSRIWHPPGAAIGRWSACPARTRSMARSRPCWRRS